MADEAIRSHRRRRDVASSTITSIGAKIAETHKRKDRSTTTLASLKHELEQLKEATKDFKTNHLAIVDLVDETALDTEQATLDKHHEWAARLFSEIHLLVTECEDSISSPSVTSSTPARTSPNRQLTKRLTYIQKKLEEVTTAVDTALADPDVDTCLLSQYDSQLTDAKTEITCVSRDLLALETEDPALSALESELRKMHFEIALKIRRSLQDQAKSSTTPDGSVKLPRLDVPTFDGNFVHWQSFWEQYSISVHSRKRLTDSEKLAYLKQALKGGGARHVVEGLSNSGDDYKEAIDCLQKRYDRPRLIHQAHVRAILEAPTLKDGNGKELRRLHDIVNQHLRALKAMDCEPSGQFITSALELKLDDNTMFEWQKYSQSSTSVPHYSDFLTFLNLRAQATETLKSRPSAPNKIPSFPANVQTPRPAPKSPSSNVKEACLMCKSTMHQLHSCPKFKGLPLEQMVAWVKSNGLCINCLRTGHIGKHCSSVHRCRKCQRRHHTLLHSETNLLKPPDPTDNPPAPPAPNPVPNVHANTAQSTHQSSQILLMTARVLVTTNHGTTIQARALLDSASSTSFISKRLVQLLHIPHVQRAAQITGIGGISGQTSTQSVVQFRVSSIWSMNKMFEVEAIVLPKVTCDLPVHPIQVEQSWTHLKGIHFADPDFSVPGSIDILLGVDVFSSVLLDGRRSGATGSPIAVETAFGWVIAGSTHGDQTRALQPAFHVVVHHSTVMTTDELLRKFWEVEEILPEATPMSLEERAVLNHFHDNHKRDETGRFMVPILKKSNVTPLGESRPQAYRRFISLERSLEAKGQLQSFNDVMEEYLTLNHAEIVPDQDLKKPNEEVFYLPIQVVVKESSSTTKVRAVFDASSKSTSGTSLNDQLMTGPTVHPSLVDVLLRFRQHRIALTTDVSKMYRAISLHPDDRDLHRFVWRRESSQPPQDYRMTRLTFGVSSSSFIANMAVKQNAIDHAARFPLASQSVHKSFYVDDGLVGADSIEEAVKLQQQLHNLFSEGGFMLHKWKSSSQKALEHVPVNLLDPLHSQALPDPDGFSKALGVEWSATLDCFRLSVTEFPQVAVVTKRALVSDVAKTYDVLGWFAPSIIYVKILLQRLWERGIAWDEPVPEDIRDSWEKWKKELPVLTKKLISRCYYPKDAQIVTTQLHGFSDASEAAYSGVLYLRMVDTTGRVHVTLVQSKTKVAPLKRLTIPRLELSGANVLAKLLHHVQKVFDIPSTQVFAWTDSMVVLCWLNGNPRRFKTFVGNRVSNVIDLVSSDRWRHVRSGDNPADPASRGLLPSELMDCELWWKGPAWLSQDEAEWPEMPEMISNPEPAEVRVISLPVIVSSQTSLPIVDDFSSFTHLKRITAWIKRFVHNCRRPDDRIHGFLKVKELEESETYWVAVAQSSSFPKEIALVKKKAAVKGRLAPLCPILNDKGLLCVRGRTDHSNINAISRHPIILPKDHTVTKLLIRSEHLRLLHAGPTLVAASLSRRFHIVGARRKIRSITRSCVTCRRVYARTQQQLLGQLPADRFIPGPVFQHSGVDYAGPLLIKLGATRRPVLVKAYVCVFVSFSVKAVHLEAVSDLTADAFIAALRRFVARRGKPSVIWSDHGTNFTGANRELKSLYEFLHRQQTQGVISQFCTAQSIEWKFIPEKAPHFGGLWEAAVKSMKLHLKKVVGGTKLSFEELTTVLSQIEACLNSRPLAVADPDDGVEPLTPGHFLVGQPLEALPEAASAYQPISTLRRWQLCQALTSQFWQRWSTDYLTQLSKFNKWRRPSKNIQVNDVVCIKEDNMVPTQWPLARVTAVYPGSDGRVRVADVKTEKGTYKRPVTKLVLILPDSD